MSDEAHFFCGCRESMTADAVRAWGKRRLLWTVQGSLPGVTAQNFRAAIDQAFDSWQGVCGLEFAEAAQGQAADIIITAGRIDGQNNVLAWSELPDGSDRPLQQRYDTSERYVVAENPGRSQIDLVAVACHEIGHAIGLEHAAQNSPDLMAPTYSPGRRTPQPGDVARIQRLYGPARTPPDPNPNPEPNPEPGAGDPVVIRIYGADRVEIPGYRVTKIR